MRDILLRVLMSAVISAVIASGLIYFAFDQSLRGVETAVSGTNASLTSLSATTNDRLLALDDKFDSAGVERDEILRKLDEIADAQEDRLDEVVDGITGNRDRFRAEFLSAQQANDILLAELLRISGYSAEFGEILVTLQPNEQAQRDRIIGLNAQIAASTDRLRQLQSTWTSPTGYRGPFEETQVE